MLHLRGYMDYHSDRFSDCSLIACRKGIPAAILPANITGEGHMVSHQGLTYGAWLTPACHFDGTDMLYLFEAWLEWCRSHGISGIFYKAVPNIYHRLPADEDLYALFRFGATPWYTNLSSAIRLRNNPGFNTLQRRHLRKASTLTPWIRETDSAEEFMPVLEECLRQRHASAPVHTGGELQKLKDTFHDGIRLFMCGTGSDTEAEVCIYHTYGVAHCQYIATTEAGRSNGTLSYLMRHLITDIFASARYFDFGTSNEASGMILNSGLLHQKYGLGGRGIAYQAFKIEI